MCGIFGYVYYGNDFGTRRNETRRALYAALAKASMQRGSQASGIAYGQGDSFVIRKKPCDIISADFDFPDHTPILMGHCRLTLFDDHENNVNNHPFGGMTKDRKTFALMHNGILAGLANLRKTYDLPKTDIETDSYVAVQLLNQYEAITLETLRTMCETLQGSYLFTVLSEDGSLYLCRGDVPVYLVHFKDEEIYLYTSTQDLFETAILSTDLALAYKTNNIDAARSRVERIVLEKGSILKLAADGTQTQTAFHFNEDRSIYHNWYTHDIVKTPALNEQIANLGN